MGRTSATIMFCVLAIAPLACGGGDGGTTTSNANGGGGGQSTQGGSSGSVGSGGSLGAGGDAGHGAGGAAGSIVGPNGGQAGASHTGGASGSGSGGSNAGGGGTSSNQAGAGGTSSNQGGMGGTSSNQGGAGGSGGNGAVYTIVNGGKGNLGDPNNPHDDFWEFYVNNPPKGATFAWTIVRQDANVQATIDPTVHDPALEQSQGPAAATMHYVNSGQVTVKVTLTSNGTVLGTGTITVMVLASS